MTIRRSFGVAAMNDGGTVPPTLSSMVLNVQSEGGSWRRCCGGCGCSCCCSGGGRSCGCSGSGGCGRRGCGGGGCCW